MLDRLVLVDRVSKKFCRSLRRSLWYGVRDLGSELVGSTASRTVLRRDEFWALRDVSLELCRGETLGLIGHNGAGKTTLLRLLGGLIRPDEGRIEVRGRMQSLVALGAGFNPVLTGRENVYVNAAVLGMSTREIDAKFEEIVEFSGIGEFIDAPVQSYSSGMVVRLGFSVAAHLEPDVLLVDEVLAVGDLAFRTKCQRRIQHLRGSGVAIILVSHNLHTISHVCSRAVVLGNGRVQYEGSPEKAIDVYRGSLIEHHKMEQQMRAGTGEIRIRNVELLDGDSHRRQEYPVGSYARIRIRFFAKEPVERPVFNIVIRVLNGDQVTGIRTDVDALDTGVLQGEGFIDILIPQLNLLPNIYAVDAVVFHKDGFTFYDRVNEIGHFKVTGGLEINGTTYLPHRYEMTLGRFQPTPCAGGR
jgi:lipopolysaccharide transport system ATP-binding protein